MSLPARRKIMTQPFPYISAGTVYLWDAKYSVDHIYQTDSSGAGLQSGCTQLTLFAQSAAVCEGTNGPQLQSSLQLAVTHATCTLGGEHTLLMSSCTAVSCACRSSHRKSEIWIACKPNTVESLLRCRAWLSCTCIFRQILHLQHDFCCAGLVLMYLAFSMLLALSSSAAGRAAADHHYILEDPFGKAPSSPECPTVGLLHHAMARSHVIMLRQSAVLSWESCRSHLWASG